MRHNSNFHNHPVNKYHFHFKNLRICGLLRLLSKTGVPDSPISHFKCWENMVLLMYKRYEEQEKWLVVAFLQKNLDQFWR